MAEGERRMTDSLPTPYSYWSTPGTGSDSSSGGTPCDAPLDDTVFKLRIGPDYSRNKKKAPSLSPMFETIGMDVYRTPSKTLDIVKRIQLPKLPSDMQGPVAGVPPLFIVNLILPVEDPPNPLFSSYKQDGPSYSLMAYFLMRPETREILADPERRRSSPAHQLLSDFCTRDDLKDRFKFLANLCNVKAAKLPSLLERLVVQYNMKPVLSRPQHYWYSDNERYIECDIDVHQFNYIARRGWSTMKSLTPELIIDAAFTIEGRTDDELPERLLGVCRCRHVQIDVEETDFSREPVVDHSQSSFTLSDLLPHVFPPEPDEGVGSNMDEEMLEEEELGNDTANVPSAANDIDASATPSQHGPGAPTARRRQARLMSTGSLPATPRQRFGQGGRGAKSAERHRADEDGTGTAWPILRHGASSKRSVSVSDERSLSRGRGWAHTSPMIAPVSPNIKIETTLHMPLDRLAMVFGSPQQEHPSSESEDEASAAPPTATDDDDVPSMQLAEDAEEDDDDEFFDCQS